jgi:galactokinase
VPGFAALYGSPPDAVADAHGRVNLIGEHTDYNGGFVLPTPVPQRTCAEVGRRSGARVRVWSEGFNTAAPDEYQLGGEAPRRRWIDYVQGVTAILREAGHAPGGFDLRLTSDVPSGAGLASSAALEVAVLRALRAAFSLTIDDVALAKLGQRAEREFVGAPVGIMDQMVASLGVEGAALFLDTRTLETERIPLPAGSALVVIDSGVKHGHAHGEYRTRRSECERAAKALGVDELRDVGPADLDRVAALPAPLDRRARHVVTENARVIDAVAAMKAGDLARVGALFAASHASMRDDYEVSVPEVDALVEAAAADPDVFGARLTGGGFGGAIVALARAGTEHDAARRIADRYARTANRRGVVLLPKGLRADRPILPAHPTR